MSFKLLQLPEELLVNVFEIAASLHVPPMSPTRPGFQPLLNDSSISALSFTCKRVRRLVLPILFRSIRIAPGFIDQNRTEDHVRSPNMQPFVNVLRNSSSWRLNCVRHLRIMDTGVDLKVFVLDLLSLFTALERVELAAGITVRELGLNYSSTSWTRLRFRTTLTFINIIETLDDVDSFWEFLSIHPAVEKVFVGEATSSLKSSNSYRLLRKIIPEAPRVLEGLSCFFLHIRIKKEKGTWWLKNVVMSIECGEGLVEGFCSKVQQLGHEFNGLEVLFLTTTKWDRNRRPEDPSIEDAFARALSTYNQLKHFSIWVPEDLKSYIEDNKQLLGLDPKYWGSAEHVYRRAAFRIAHRIAVAVPSIEQVDFLDILHNQNSVVFGENCYVIIQRDDADVKVVEGAIRFEYRSDRPYGTGSVVPVGDAWSPSML